MAQHLALVENEAASSDEALYDALLAALSSTARGRAFLEEHARRVRAHDTAAALAALARIEAMLVEQQTLAGEVRSPGERSEPGEAAAPDFAEPVPGRGKAPSRVLHPGYKNDETAREGLLAQVMALSPEERIALFS